MKYRADIFAIVMTAGMASACAANGQDAPLPNAAPVIPVAEPTSLIGPSYKIGDVTYTPAETGSYDAVGYAEVSGANGQATAIGEPYRPDAIAAAHKTLPLPSYIEVTDIANGRTILVRVVDRGPMRNDRLIALTPAAAEQLGVASDTPIAVRVRKVNPPQAERDVLIAGGQAIERLPTTKQLLAVLRRKLAEQDKVAGHAPPSNLASAPPKPAIAAPVPAKPMPTPAKPAVQPARPTSPVVKPEPVGPATPAMSASGSYYVQIAAFKSKASADAVAKKADASVAQGSGVYRVRLGPYADAATAQKALAATKSKGYRAAIVVRDR